MPYVNVLPDFLLLFFGWVSLKKCHEIVPVCGQLEASKYDAGVVECLQ